MSDTTDMPSTAPIPVYASRFTPGLEQQYPNGYGAHVMWSPGDRCWVKSIIGNPSRMATVRSDGMLWHPDAPVIDSARGPGKWVVEAVLDGESSPRPVPANQLYFDVESPAPSLL